MSFPSVRSLRQAESLEPIAELLRMLLARWLEKLGYRVAYQSTKKKTGRRRSRAPVILWSRALGITGKPRKLISGFESGRHRSFDVGLVRGSWGESPFFETVGVGLFAEAMCLVDSKEGTAHGAHRRRKFGRDLRFLCRALLNLEPRSWTVKLDEQDLSGDYLLCEVLNTGSTGPRLPLVRDADPTDGLLDVVLLGEQHRERFRRYLVARSLGDG